MGETKYESNRVKPVCRICKAFDHISDVFFVLDRNFRFMDLNKATERIVSMQKEELIKKSVWDVFRIQPDSISYKMFMRSAEEKKGVCFQSMCSLTGKQIEIYTYPLEGGLAVIQHDLSNYAWAGKTGEKSEREERLTDFLEALSDVNAIIDEDGRIIELFGSKKNLLPKPHRELVGRTFHQVLPAQSADLLLHEVQQTILTGIPRCFIYEFKSGKDIIYVEERISPFKRRVNQKGVAAVILTDISKQRKAEKMLQFQYELKRKSDFLNDIIYESVLINEKVIAGAKSWGIDFARPLSCVLISSGEKIPPPWKKNGIIALLSTSPDYIVWDCRAYIGIIFPLKELDNSWKLNKKTAEQIRETIREDHPDFTGIIGVSNCHTGPDSLKKAFCEAQSAVVSAKCQSGKEVGIRYYDDIGVFQILGFIGESQYAQEYVQRMIGPLLDYDRQKGTNLLLTLKEILESTSLNDAAKKMFLHAKTLGFRKRRIEKVLGVSLDHFDTRLALATAIKLQKTI